MTCPSCRSAMEEDHDHWNCPTCQGQFYTASQTEGVDEAWRHSMDTYYKAMRNLVAIARADRKGGYHLVAREREAMDMTLKYY